jgi:hypothetical protein
MNRIETYNQLLDTRGFPLLRDLGILDVALSRADVLAAIELLHMGSIPILGGDVYWQRPSGIENAYANWHSDPQPGEDRHDFATRNCLESQQYIANYPQSDAVDLFVLVIDDQESIT